ncbi:MAG: V-type ATPase 116kDa subunit family protein, partial [Candidatus Margulisiibacteriota bacterium]
FFAMCLSDVGYGLILALVSFYLLGKLTLSEGGKKLLWLLFWGGIATVFVGILTGSYFGLDLNTLPPTFGLALKRLQIIDPIKNPLNVLILSLSLGVIQNLFGIALAMYWKIINKDYLSAFLDDGLWIFFLSSLVLLVVVLGLNSPLISIFSRAAIAAAILLVLTQGRHEQNIFKKLLTGILSLYRTTSYLGDTLSYSRLLALMMTTSIIGMVVNILAGLTKNSIPILGYVIMIAILIIGHTFNLVVSVLGAFIHAARLQLVEFFGKFYEGSGREFRPFQRETKYVKVEV